MPYLRISWFCKTGHLTTKGAEIKPTKGTVKNICPLCASPATYKVSQPLKGLAKMGYDKEHKDSLSKYPELKERMPR